MEHFSAPLDFVERLVFAGTKRGSLLTELSPKSNDFHFLRSLFSQDESGDGMVCFDEWNRQCKDKSIDESQQTIICRQAILDFPSNPTKSSQLISDFLGLKFTHTSTVVNDPSAYDQFPSHLDQNVIKFENFVRKEILADPRFGRSSQKLLRRLIEARSLLTDEQRLEVIRRIHYPDVDHLMEDLIAVTLKDPSLQRFGSLEIHGCLLPEQLGVLTSHFPSMIEDPEYVQLRLDHILPTSDEDVEFDFAVRRQWLDKVWNFVVSLSSRYTSTKIRFLARDLQCDEEQGRYIEAKYRILGDVLRYQSQNPDKQFLDIPLNNKSQPLPDVCSSDLFRRFFLVLFGSSTEDPEFAITRWLDLYTREELLCLYAEAWITSFPQVPSQSFEGLSRFLKAERLNELRQCSELSIAKNSPRYFEWRDKPPEIKIILIAKNVPDVSVKVYDLDILAHYKKYFAEPTIGFDVDGITPTFQNVIHLSSNGTRVSPFVRQLREIELKELYGKRGTFLIDFVAGAFNCRAIIRVGHWKVLTSLEVHGDSITVLDEIGRVVPRSWVYVDGQRFKANENGDVLVPFSGNPGVRCVVFGSELFACLGRFVRHQDNPTLTCAVYHNQEQIAADRRASLVVRASLLVGTNPPGRAKNVRLKMMSDLKFSVTTRSSKNIRVTRVFDDVQIEDRVHTIVELPFFVDNDIEEVFAEVSGVVENCEGDMQTVTASSSRFLGGHGGITQCFLTSDSSDDSCYELQVLGRNGESLAGRCVMFKFHFEDFNEVIGDIVLQTNSNGIIKLGRLENIFRMESALDGKWNSWYLRFRLSAPLPRHINSLLAEEIDLPIVGECFSILEKAGRGFVSDDRCCGRVEGGRLKINDAKGRYLGAGDYLVRVGDQELTLTVSSGVLVGKEQRALFQPHRMLAVGRRRLVYIESVRFTSQACIIIVQSCCPCTVYVSASHFLAQRGKLSDVWEAVLENHSEVDNRRLKNECVSNRRVDTEMQYIMTRKSAKPLLGNMLERPGLLLHKFEIGSTDTCPLGGESSFCVDSKTNYKAPCGVKIQERCSAPMQVPSIEEGRGKNNRCDFIADQATILLNLIPDSTGAVNIPLAALCGRKFLQVLASNEYSFDGRTMVVPGHHPLKLRDMRMTEPFSSPKELAREGVVCIPGRKIRLGASFSVCATSKEVFDGLMTGIPSDEKSVLCRFGWICSWGSLTEIEKLEKYDTFCCHEINLFLKNKDPTFFQTIILPYLKNKRELSFFDEYLLGNDLSKFETLPKFTNLNVVERCLLALAVPSKAEIVHQQIGWQLEVDPSANEKFNISFDRFLKTDNTTALAPALMSVVPPFRTSMPGARNIGLMAVSTFRGGGWVGSSGVEEAAAAQPDGLDFGRAAELRKSVKGRWKPLGATKEFAEVSYFNRDRNSTVSELMHGNRFWLDFADWIRRDKGRPFLSANVHTAGRSACEVLLALAVLDIPFCCPTPVSLDLGVLVCTPTDHSALVLQKFARDIETSEDSDVQENICVSHSFSRLDSPSSDPRPVVEFLPSVAYRCIIVISNLGHSQFQGSLLYQTPKGSIQLEGNSVNSQLIDLPPNQTLSVEFSFYFPFHLPHATHAQMYPPTISREGRVVASCRLPSLVLVQKPSTASSKDWLEISQTSTSDEQILTFLESANLEKTNLSLVCWRCRKSKSFFVELTSLLNRKSFFNFLVFSYSLFHCDQSTAAIFLRNSPKFVRQLGPYLDCFWFSVDSYSEQSRLMELDPLVHQHVHTTNLANRTNNSTLLKQYSLFLEYCVFSDGLNNPFNLAQVVYYLFLQDRVDEALHYLNRIKSQPIKRVGDLQFAYLECYAAFCQGRPDEARATASKFSNHPVPRWAKLFSEVLAQADEILGVSPIVDDPSNSRGQAMAALTAPFVKLEKRDGKLFLLSSQVSFVRITFTSVDLEVSFSRAPFSFQGSFEENLPLVKPHSEMKVAVSCECIPISLPDDSSASCLLVNAIGDGVAFHKILFDRSTLAVTLKPELGLMVVRSGDKLLPQAYVKVYAKLADGRAAYVKDGYTDMRGMFNYALCSVPAGVSERVGFGIRSLTSADLPSVRRYALLVTDPTRGSSTIEAPPPHD